LIKKQFEDLEVGTWFSVMGNTYIKIAPQGDHAWDAICILAPDNEIDNPGQPSAWNPVYEVTVLEEFPN